MPLVTVVDGETMDAADVQQYGDVLSGALAHPVQFTALDDPASYALDVRNLDDTNSRGFRVQTAEGDNMLTVRRVSGNDVVSIGIVDGGEPANTRFAVVLSNDEQYYVMSDCVYTNTHTAGPFDVGAFRTVARQFAGGASSNNRAAEIHMLNFTGASTGVFIGADVSANTKVPGNGQTSNVAIFVRNLGDYSDPGEVFYRADTGIFIGRDVEGFEFGIRYEGTVAEGSPVLFTVDKVGTIAARSILPILDNTHSLGGATNQAWIIIYSHTYATSDGGAVGAPPFRNGSDTNTGIYFPSADNAAITTGGVNRFQVTNGGGVILGAQAALATTATDGFAYMPSGAGPPTGTPTAVTGKVAWYFDTTNNQIYIYDGAWLKTAALT